VLAVLLAAASVWHWTSTSQAFQYGGRERWFGPWDNPNTYGLLMGVGIVAGLGHGMPGAGHSPKIGRRKQSAGVKDRLVAYLTGSFLFVLVCLTANGLARSYSRGAWVACVCGIGYVVWQGIHRLMFSAGAPEPEAHSHSARLYAPWLIRNSLPLSVIILSILTMAFWQFRQTERLLVRRAFSLSDPNDFSWRNRIAAWEGALQMMAEKPWSGFGWNQLERCYDSCYRLSRITEAPAIQTNDYLLLGATLGIPALACFVAYVGLALSRRLRANALDSDSRASREAAEGAWSRAVCRAGGVVLLVGFWFDGGLLKLATGATFWILLELGREA
jgi:O-antigen ligase